MQKKAKKGPKSKKIKCDVDFSGRQTEAYDVLGADNVTEVLFGGAKRLSLDTQLLTPTGYIPNGVVEVGQELLNPDGTICRVIGLSPIVDEEQYTLVLKSGRRVTACRDHLWYGNWRLDKSDPTQSWDNPHCVKTTAQIVAQTDQERDKDGHKRLFHIPLSEPVAFGVELHRSRRTIDPYFLGLLLGDGCITGKRQIKITTGDVEHIIKSLRSLDIAYRVTSFEGYGKRCWDVHIIESSKYCQLLAGLGLKGCYAISKYIPGAYLYAPIVVRQAIFQGLMDTDGTVAVDGQARKCYYYTISSKLSEQMRWLALSLGYYGKVECRAGRDKVESDGRVYHCQPCYELSVRSMDDRQFFRLERHRDKVIPIADKSCQWSRTDTVVDVIHNPVKVPMRCITVDNPNGLYLANDFVVTHNSGGKSVLGCYWMMLESVAFAKQYLGDKPAYPIQFGWMGRKISKHFKDTTLETWKKMIPSGLYTLKGDPPQIIIMDRVKIKTGGLQSAEILQEMNSAEFCRIFLDQAEECTQDDVACLRATINRPINIPGYGSAAIPGKILYTANPAPCWLKDEFIDAPSDNQRFVQSLPSDNPHISQAYIETLKTAFSHRPNLLRAYLDGVWEDLVGINQLIQSDWITAAGERRSWSPFVKEYLSVDWSRFGDDETVILHMANSEILGEHVFERTKSVEISSFCAQLSHKRKGIPVIVECIGACMGSAIIDELETIGVETIEYNPGSKDVSDKMYYNKRAEAWDTVGRIMQSGILCQEHNIPFICNNMSRQMRQELTWPTYDYRNSRMLVEDKSSIKAKHGKSTDRADAFIQAIYMWDVVPIKQDNADIDRFRTPSRHRSAMAG